MLLVWSVINSKKGCLITNDAFRSCDHYKSVYSSILNWIVNCQCHFPSEFAYNMQHGVSPIAQCLERVRGQVRNSAL